MGLLATTAVLAGVPGVPAHGSQNTASRSAAAKECPELTPKMLAAQIDQESGFDPMLSSPRGGQRIAQFIPDAWAVWGRDLDGDGVASPYNPGRKPSMPKRD